MAKRSRKRRKARRRQASGEDSSQGSTDSIMNDSIYQHNSLLDGEKFFRLLELLPGKEDDAVRCRLRTYSINFHPSYDAISYVWGHEKDKTDIFCNRKRLLIPWNLCDVLKRLRHQESSRILWADSICIDQNNKDERGHQVQLMRAIFRQAENVNAWLGRGDNFDSDTAFQLIDHLYNLWSSEELTQESIHQVSSYQLDQLRSLLRSPWFERVWILQEVGLAPDAFLLCGPSKTRWKNLILPSRYLGNCFWALLDELALRFTQVHKMKFDFVKGKDEDIRTILKALIFRKCSNPRDKIYAALGHVAFEHIKKAAGGIPFIEINYSESVSNLYFDTAKRLLELPNPLRILSIIDHTHSTINDPCQVSWVPQWRSNLHITPASLGKFEDLQIFYRACGLKTPQVMIDDQTLVLEGLCLDSIDWKSATFEEICGGQETDATFRSIWEELKKPTSKFHGTVRHSVSKLCSTFYAGGPSRISNVWWAGGDRDVDDRIASFLAYLRSNGIIPHARDALIKEYAGGMAERFLMDMRHTCYGRCFFIGEKGFLGLGPRITQPGDKICFFFGAQVPFILRPQQDSGAYRLCGECYVDGMMYGEIIEMFEDGELEQQTFRLV